VHWLAVDFRRWMRLNTSRLATNLGCGPGRFAMNFGRRSSRFGTRRFRTHRLGASGGANAAATLIGKNDCRGHRDRAAECDCADFCYSFLDSRFHGWLFPFGGDGRCETIGICAAPRGGMN
jgi:hypothetical protein